ncbi:hypothetical protein [Stutzerimonas stutzeri]|uniref:hypothetical protein n=1 Tax=Stutzerimonas stutzeri TaxID=316 RepID=UPI0011D0DA8A|nr:MULTISPECIES: hypothetical protein [Pseudomonadaceae]UWG61262.1 hypothetical protein NDR94_03700 [Stutzerimonas stutzeri]
MLGKIILHTFERATQNDIDIDSFTLEFCWKFAQNCSRHFMEHLANEPQLVTDTNHLAHYLLSTAAKNSFHADKTAQPTYSNSVGHNPSYSQPPDNLKPGAQTTFTITQVKQYGPSSLRGRANSDRLEAAITLLTKLGHISKEGSRYHFKETILLHKGEPELKNGEILTIKELPLFREQVYWQPKRHHPLVKSSGYFIEIQN